MLIDHVIGERFSGRQYEKSEVSRFVQSVAEPENVLFPLRVILRFKDLNLEPQEIGEAIQAGKVLRWEVTPDRWELRIEIEADGGDLFSVVVYISKDHQVYCEDVREIRADYFESS